MGGGFGDGGLAGLFVEDLGWGRLGVVGDCAGGVFGGVGGHLGVVLLVLLLLEVLGWLLLLLLLLVALVLRVPDALEGVLGCGAGGLLDVEVAEV